MRWICILVAIAASAQNPPATNPPAKAPPAESASPKVEPWDPLDEAPVPSPRGLMQTAVGKQWASIAIQRQAVLKQAELAGASVAGFPCDPMSDAAVTPIIDGAAQSLSLEPKLLRAVIEQESGYRPCVVSSKGAKGLMQLMPETAQQLGVRDPFDPRDNVQGGAKYLKELLDKYQGNLSMALSAYNAGPSRVDQAGGIPDIPETRNYVNSILQKVGTTRTAQPKIPKPKPTEN